MSSAKTASSSSSSVVSPPLPLLSTPMQLQPTSSSSFVAGPTSAGGGNTQFPRSNSDWSSADGNGGSVLPPAPPSDSEGREGRVLHISETPQGGGFDDLMARLSSVSSQYHTTEQQQAQGQQSQREGSPSGAPVPPIQLDRITERSSRSSAGSNGHSNGNGKTKVPSRSNHKHSPAPLVPPALDDRDVLVSKFNPLSAQRLAAQQAAASAAVVAAAKNDGAHTPPAAAMRVPAPSNEEGDEVEMAAVRSITGGLAAGNGGALGDRRHEQQKLLHGGGGSGGGGGGGNSHSNPTAGFADDEAQEHFLCGLIPRRFRREFWAPLACVLLMLAVATIVALVLYNNLHQKELDSFVQQLNSSCAQRSKLLQQNFGFAVASMQSMAGFFSVQQRYQSNGTLFTESDWKLYVAQSNLPGFVERFLFMPRVLDRDRDAFEALTGHPITDLVCLNSTFRPQIAYDYAPRDQFFFTPRSAMGLCFTTRNLTHPQGLNSNFTIQISYTHVRNRFPYYFPYQFKYPEFSDLPVGVEDLYNIDATILFPLQDVSFKSISEPIANGLLKFSERQSDLANAGQYGIVATIPIFEPDKNLTRTGNLTTDFAANMEVTIGLVAGVLRTHNALQLAVDALQYEPLLMVLYDTFRDESLPASTPQFDQFVTSLYPANIGRAPDNYALSNGNVSTSFNYGQRPYRLDCVPTKAYVETAYSSTPLLIAVGAAVLVGICVLMLVCGWLMLNVRRTNHRAQLLAEANAGKNVALELLAEAKELADRANKSKSDFLAFLCHELRNPLHAISAMVEFLHHDYFRQQHGRVSSPHSDINGNNTNQDTTPAGGGMHAGAVPLGGGGGGGGGGMGGGSSGAGTGAAASSAPESMDRSKTNSPVLANGQQVPDGTLTMLPTAVGLAGSSDRGGDRSHKPHRRRSHSGMHSGVGSSLGGGHNVASRRKRRVEAAECVTIINTQVTMMRSILDDFLDMSKIESGVLHFEKIGFELALLAKQCVQSMSSKCKEKGIRIRLRLNQVGLPRKGYADPTRIKQLILNLLTNAIKFTSVGAVELFVEAIPMTHASAVAAELPAEAFEWGFGESVAMEGPSTAAGGTLGPKASRSRNNGGTPSRERSKVPIVVVQPVPSIDEHKEHEPGAAADNKQPNAEAPKAPAADPARPNKIILHIAVTDSGSGIAPSALPHLFQPYSQEKLSIMRTHGGTGLGLAIVKNIVAHMHGSIHVTSQQGKGSKFSLHLPIDCRRPGALPGSDEQAEETAHEAELQSTVNRLRALHHAEEEEDVIESHLVDKFERSRDFGAGLGSSGSNQNSNSESDSNDGSRMVPKPRGAHGSPPTFRATNPSGALRAEAHRALIGAPPIVGAGGTWAGGGAPILPQVARDADVSASPESSSVSSDQSNHSSSVQVTFHTGDASRSVSSNKRAQLEREAQLRDSHLDQSLQEQVEGRPDPSTPNLHPTSATSLGTSGSSPAVGPQQGSMASPPSVAVDLLTASKSDPLTSSVLWPTGSSASAPGSAHSQTRQLPSTPTLYLLLVDDAEVNLKILQKMLGSSIVVAGSKFKLALTTAANGLDAMQKVEQRWAAAQGPASASTTQRQPAAFDAILSDIVMPLADGFQFARLLRDFESKQSLSPAPLVALTANALKADVDAYTAASFRWFVPKPFRRADLHGVLHTVLAATISPTHSTQHGLHHQHAAVDEE